MAKKRQILMNNIILLKKWVKIKNSPIKFIVPGNPKFETIKKKNNTEKSGIILATPLKNFMFLVWNLLYSIPIQKNNPAEARPCANMSITLPEIEEIFNENKPNKHIFIWPIEAYAIILFISIWIDAEKEV